MVLSEKATRALEQVKHGLNMLYGADYFTEEEWVKIDGLIHKGEYVFTNGPPTTNFLEDELMSFDEIREATAPLDLQSQNIFEMPERGELVEDVKEETQVAEQSELQEKPITETEQLSSAGFDATSSIPETRSSGPSSAPTPIPQSLEVSSDEEHAAPESDAKVSSEEPSFDLSSDLSNPPSQVLSHEQGQSQEAFEPPKHVPVAAPRNGGLAYYTQDQLDEMKAFNRGLTKAGEKKKPSYKTEKPTDSSHDGSEQVDWVDEMLNDNSSQCQDYPSPATTDEDNRIQNWASSVGTQATENPKDKLVNDFIKAHGRLPRSVNDIYQPRNQEFTPLTGRPISRATSNRAVKRPLAAKSVTSAVDPMKSGSSTNNLTIASGTVLTALSSAEVSPAQLRIEVMEGDQIKIIKHVSGLMYYGSNMRTMKSGQVPETIFMSPTAAQSVAHAQQKAAQNSRMRAANSTSNGMQQFERLNAREWDEVPQPHRATAAPTPVRSMGGLGASRYAVSADDKKSEDSEGFAHGMTREDVDQLVNEKFKQLLQARQFGPNGRVQTAHTPSYSTTSDRKFIDPLKPVQPKTATCWFWATPNKDCRFTADECRDLHAFAPTNGSSPGNLRMGKPTWGALADGSPASPLPQSHNIALSSHLQSSKSGFVPVYDNTNTTASDNTNISKLTCHFWANQGKCSYSADQCKYLHAWGPDGVAKAPRSMQSKTLDWSRWDSNHSDRQREEPSQNGGWGETNGGWGDENANANTNGSSWEVAGNSGAKNAGNSWNPTGNEENPQSSDSGTWGASSGDAWEAKTVTNSDWEAVGNKRRSSRPTTQPTTQLTPTKSWEQVPNAPLTSWGGSNDNTWNATTSLVDTWGNGGLKQEDSNSASVSAWGDVGAGKPVHVQALEEKVRVEAVGW